MGAVESGGAAARSDQGEDPPIGLVLQDRYRILACIASGGMGVVYRAKRLQLERQVAIKFLLQDSVGREPQALKRFELEARAMSRLSHPNCDERLSIRHRLEHPMYVRPRSVLRLLRRWNRFAAECGVSPPGRPSKFSQRR